MNISPSKQEFLAHCTAANLIPLSCRLLADFETPLSVYQKIAGQGESFLFESIEGGEHLNRYSFTGSQPRGVVIQNHDRVEHWENGKLKQSFQVTPGASNPSLHQVKDGLEVLELVMSQYRLAEIPMGIPFSGGAVGFIGYEFIHDVEPSVPRPLHDELKTPTLYFIIADRLAIFDRVAQQIILVIHVAPHEHASHSEAYDFGVNQLLQWVHLISRNVEHPIAIIPDQIPDIPFTSNQSEAQFHSNVDKARTYINQGDIIQVVGSQRFSTQSDLSPIQLYRAARSINPSPYMFLLELNGLSLVGASPEIHTRCENRHVEIRPIAGTRPRGKTQEEDLMHEADLLADPKERAEHVMLVDLARNDIGRVCEFGSVVVKDLMVIERYSHVMHIVSQVEGQLSRSHSTYDLIRATFPAGTLSGAPKIRAMQIITELEQTSRGPYGGCVGYFAFNGNLDCCITIRTALLKDGFIRIQAGGGWVADSVPQTEFLETINKSRAMIKSVALASAFTSPQ
ncbi:MAG: anthranilate synthase component I [Verrucomicrobia bacterium]|nr:anthranilate synthase component I [Verrucomicrobiota bacterium]